MPLPLLAAGLAATAVGNIVRGRGKKSRVNPQARFTDPTKRVAGINAKYQNARVDGYTTAADVANAERTRNKGTASAARSGELARMQANRQVLARGLGGPAAAALAQKASDVEAAGREDAYNTSANELYGAYNKNKDFAGNQLMTAWGADIGASAQLGQQEYQRAQLDLGANAQADARDATFWNSLLEAAPMVASMWNPTGQAAIMGANSPSTVLSGLPVPGVGY